MTLAIITYDESSGEIFSLRHEPDHSYEPRPNETIVDDPDYHRPGSLEGKAIDVETGEIVDDTDYDPRSPLERAQDRIDQLEAATGSGNEPAERGIAKRIDNLEDRIAALEEHHA